MTNKRISWLLVPTILGLSACGSDESNEIIAPQEPIVLEERNPAWKYIESPYIDFTTYDSTLKGEVEIAIGQMTDNIQPWVSVGTMKSFGGDMSHDLNNDNIVNFRDSDAAGIFNVESGPVYKTETKDMIAYLATNPDGLGAGSSRPDIFVEGHYSVFDLLRYTVGTRDDMRFEGKVIPYTESQYGTYEFRISWDKNNDGKFDDNDGIFYDSEHWHFGFINSVGQNRHYGNLHHEYNYKRMDQFWLREDQHIRFLPHDMVMTNRRHWVWKQEQDRLASNNGKYIIPLMMHSGSRDLSITEYFARNEPPMTVATDLEVKPFNLRSDVFQPGVITSMDVWMSLAEAQGLDFRFTWWPRLSSGAIVNNFALMYHPWIGAYGGWIGSAPFQGELAAAGDFSATPFPRCDFKHDGTPTALGEGEIEPSVCNQEWLAFNGIGGNNISEVAGANIMMYPPEYMLLVSVDTSTGFANVPEIDMKRSDKVDVYVAGNELQHTSLDKKGNFDLYPSENTIKTAMLRPVQAADIDNTVGNAPILSESHFGWKIADCTQCHNLEKQPNGHGGHSWPTNVADGFDYVQPYYCASCHGNNGAPQGHNRGARCYWCHNTNNGDGLLPRNHGDASLAKFIPAEKNASNLRTESGHPLANDGSIDLYGDLWFSSHNSDYSLSKTFPDPFACTACHGEEHDIESSN